MNHRIAKYESILENLSESEQFDLLAYIASKLKRISHKGKRRDLYGILSDKVDPDFDIEAALKEIRSKWLETESMEQ